MLEHPATPSHQKNVYDCRCAGLLARGASLASLLLVAMSLACAGTTKQTAGNQAESAVRSSAPLNANVNTAGTPAGSIVRMLLVNDVYVADTLRDGSGGLARVAFLRDSIERATNSTVLYVLAGDFLSPSVLGKWYGGAQMVDVFNASRLDYATVGNHEFDGSRSNLLDRGTAIALRVAFGKLRRDKWCQISGYEWVGYAAGFRSENRTVRHDSRS